MLRDQVSDVDEITVTETAAPAPPRGRRPTPVLTEGPIARTLILFSLPILGSSIDRKSVV